MNKENISFYNQTTIYFQNNSWILLCIILATAILLRMPNLNGNLWFDELWSTHVMLRSAYSLGYLALYDSHPPFYSMFMFLWIRLFGDSEMSVRMPPLIFGILSIFLTYRLALRFTEKKGAILTSFLMCVSPVHIWYSDEARPYSETLFFLLLAIFSYYKLRESKSNLIWYLVYSASLFSAVFSHFFVSVYLAIISMMCLFKINKVKRSVLLLNILILGCLLAFLGLKSMFGTVITGQGHLRPFTFFELWMLFFNWFLFGNSLWSINPYRNDLNVILQNPLMFFTQLIFLAFFINGVIQIIKESKSREELDSLDLILYVFSLPLFLLCLNFIGFKNTYIERSVFIVLPFFYIILVKGITGLKAKPISLVCTIFTIVLSIITLTSFIKKSDEWTVYAPKPDWRAAASFFDNELKDTTKRVFIFAVKPPTELTYYDSRFEEYKIKGLDVSNKTLRKLKQLSEKSNYFVNKLYLDLTRHIQFRKERIANAQSLIFFDNKINKENIYETMSLNNVKTFYLIHKIYHRGDFRSLLEGVMKDPRFQLMGTQAFKGMEIFKFMLVS